MITREFQNDSTHDAFSVGFPKPVARNGCTVVMPSQFIILLSSSRKSAGENLAQNQCALAEDEIGAPALGGRA